MSAIMKVLGYIQTYGVKYTCKKIRYKLWLRSGLAYKMLENKTNIESIPEKGPMLSIVVPLYNTPESFLKEMLASVTAQTYHNWQLCIVDASDKAHSYVEVICRKYQNTDIRVQYKKLLNNEGIAGNTNKGLEMVTGEYIALLDHDDILHPSALSEVAHVIEKTQADFIYSDEAVFEGKINHLTSIHAKPDFSPENLRGNNYICHLCVFSKELQQKIGFFQSDYDGSQDYDMILRLTEQAEKIIHIPKVLYYWRYHKGSVSAGIDAKEYAAESGRRAVEAHLRRMGISGRVVSTKRSSVVYRTVPTEKIDAENVLICKQNEGVPEWSSEAYVLLQQQGVSDLREEDLQSLLMYATRKNVGLVCGMVQDTRGRVLQGPLYYDDRGKICMLHKGHPVNAISYMNRLLYANNVPLPNGGYLLMRTEIYRKWEAAFLKNSSEEEKNHGMFLTEQWQRLGIEMQKKELDIIYVPWISVYCEEGVADFGMSGIRLE